MASPAEKRTRSDSPSSAAVSCAAATASAEDSIPHTSRTPARARWNANPPTPQYRSHADAGAPASVIHRAAVAYSRSVTAVFVWKNPCGRRRSPMPLSRIVSVGPPANTISSSPSGRATCRGSRFALTTDAGVPRAASSSRSPGTATRSASRRSRERSTKRTISSRSGEAVTCTCLSSPVRAATS